MLKKSSTPVQSKKSTDCIDDILNENIAQEIAKYLPLKEIVAFSSLSKINHQLFKPVLDKAKINAKMAHPLLTEVVNGNPDALAFLVKENPELLFLKGNIKGLSEQIFYDVSSFQLMIFLFDCEMIEQIMSLMSPLTEEMTLLRKSQLAEIDSGGSDLIKMDRDPASLTFAEVTQFVTSYSNKAITFPLLENPDGIIYYKNPVTKCEYLYYANQKTQSIELIEPKANSTEEEAALTSLYKSFNDMEDNSSRRSSNAEHALIAATMQHKLSRKGIEYERKGMRYCDNRIAFDLVNAYRTSIRKFKNMPGLDEHKYWREDVGKAQSHVMWILQRICERQNDEEVNDEEVNDEEVNDEEVNDEVIDYFDLLSHSIISPSNRRLLIVDELGILTQTLAGEPFPKGLGEDFALRRRLTDGIACVSVSPMAHEVRSPYDLFFVCRLIENAKARLVEFKRVVDNNTDHANENGHSGPS